MYLKFAYRGEVYGPVRAPCQLHTLCRSVRVSLRALPVLEGRGGGTAAAGDGSGGCGTQPPAQVISISDPVGEVGAGFYVLHADPAIAWDEALDGGPLRPRALAPAPAPPAPTLAPAQEAVPPVPQVELDRSRPMTRQELDAAIQAMLRVFGSIPPRYFTYNRRLRCQLQLAGDRVEELRRELEALMQRRDRDHGREARGVAGATGPAMRPRRAPLEQEVALLQFAILHTLKAAWDTVWQQYAPRARRLALDEGTWRATVAPAVGVVEAALDRVNQWQRMEAGGQAWRQLCRSSTYAHLVHPSRLARFPGFKPHFLDLPELPSGRYPHAWEYLVTLPKGMATTSSSSPLPPPDSLARVRGEVRLRFLEEWRDTQACRDEELAGVLERVLDGCEYRFGLGDFGSPGPFPGGGVSGGGVSGGRDEGGAHAMTRDAIRLHLATGIRAEFRF
jgi:hypothetical protein